MMHPGNNIETRLQGMDLFLLWYQALQDNAGEHVRLIYATLIPGINKSVKSEDGRNHTFATLINDNTGKFHIFYWFEGYCPNQQKPWNHK